ncbi:hypothetical protein [Streptomyces mirabilis]|uniref:hypothetical protein n=2 Tax=Streptomyces mirabilis TaxID=68239 RepID=UPI003669D693
MAVPTSSSSVSRPSSLLAYGDQGGQQVVLGAAAFVRDKIGQQPVQTGQCRAVLGRGHPERMGRPAADVQVVLLGDVEEFGDDRGRQWCVEHLDEVGLARRRQRVDQVVGDLLDARRQFSRTAWSEGGRGQSAQTGVLGRVGLHHPRAEPDRGFVEDVAGGGQGIGGGRGVLEQGGVGRRLPGQVVADDHPALQSEVELGRMDGPEPPQPGVPRGSVRLEGGIDDHLAVLVRAFLMAVQDVSLPFRRSGRRHENEPRAVRVQPADPRTDTFEGHARCACPSNAGELSCHC